MRIHSAFARLKSAQFALYCSNKLGPMDAFPLNVVQLKEGLIEEGSAAWQGMSATDRSKRKRAAAEARTKLKSPNFFLSRTRLCLRNLPLKLNEKTLKQLVLAAVGLTFNHSTVPIRSTDVSAATP